MNDTALAIDDPGSQPDVVSAGGTSLPSASAVGADRSGTTARAPASRRCVRNREHRRGRRRLLPRVARATRAARRRRADTDPVRARAPAGRSRTSPTRPTPRPGAWPPTWHGRWTRLRRHQRRRAHQRRASSPTPTRAASARSAASVLRSTRRSRPTAATFTDITPGNNDFTDTNGGQFAAGPGFDAASGLGTPVDQNLALALQGAGGCPSVAAVSPNTGPGQRRRGHHHLRRRLRQRHLGHLRVGGPGPDRRPDRDDHHRRPARMHASAVCVDVTVANSQGVSAQSAADHYGFGGDLNCGQGYRFVASDGGVFDFGDAGFYGSTGGIPLNAPVVGMADTPSTNGYWLVASDGGIFDYGDAALLRLHGRAAPQQAHRRHGRHARRARLLAGGLRRRHLQLRRRALLRLHRRRSRSTSPSWAWPPRPDGGGYWLVASDGGIFAFGDAQFYGSTGSMHLNSPIVGMAAGPGGSGYWLVAADGGIFTYGTRRTSTARPARLHLNEPVVGMAPTPDGRRLLAGGLRRRHLQLRRHAVLRVDRQHPPEQAHRRDVVGLSLT